MYIVCLIKNETRDGQRRAAGTTIRHRVGIGVDRFNTMLCETTADAFQGRCFSPRFAWLATHFEEFEVDAEFARQQLRDALRHIFGLELADDVTFAQLDEIVHPGKSAGDSSGEIDLYRRLKAKYGTSRTPNSSEDEDTEADEGTVILYEPSSQPVGD